MTKHKKYISLLLIIFQVFLSYGQNIIEQSSPKRPMWLNEIPSGKYYIYYSGIGSSEISLSDAKEQAIANVLSGIIMQKGIIVESEIRAYQEENNDEIISQFSREILQTGKTTKIKGLLKEEEYWTTIKSNGNIIYQYWILMKIPKSSYMENNYIIKQGYGFKPILKSAVLPGWGQFHKGESVKGSIFLISETALISTLFISNYYSQYYSAKAANELDNDRRLFYNDWAYRSYTISVVSGITAGALYIYNIIDAVVAKGDKKYAFNKMNDLDITADLNPKHVGLIFTYSY